MGHNRGGCCRGSTCSGSSCTGPHGAPLATRSPHFFENVKNQLFCTLHPPQPTPQRCQHCPHTRSTTKRPPIGKGVASNTPPHSLALASPSSPSRRLSLPYLPQPRPRPLFYNPVLLAQPHSAKNIVRVYAPFSRARKSTQYNYVLKPLNEVWFSRAVF